METIQIAPIELRSPPNLPRIEAESHVDELSQYLEDTINTIDVNFTDYGSGFPLSTYDHTLGGYDSQISVSNIEDMGSAFISTAVINKVHARPPIWMKTRAGFMLRGIEDIMRRGEGYHNGAFAADFHPNGLPSNIQRAPAATPKQHGMLLDGMTFAANEFPELKGDFEDLIKEILFQSHKAGFPIAGQSRYGEIPPSRDNEYQDKIIRLFKNEPSPSKTKPSDIFHSLKTDPLATFQQLRDLITEYPEIYLEESGFVEDIDSKTGLPKQTQQYKHQVSILLDIINYQNQDVIENSVMDSAFLDPSNEESELLLAA